MTLETPKYKIIEQEPGINGIYKQIELAGRTCYKSEDKITEDSAKSFVMRMIESKHTAMLEHGTVYLKIEHKYDNGVDMKDIYDILKKMSVDIEPLQEESHKLFSECKKLENEEYVNNTNKENNIQREEDKKNFEKNNWVVCYRKNNGPWKYRGIPVCIQSFHTNEIDANNDKHMHNRRSSIKVYYSCNVNKLKINEL